jgi:hypothetical protein
MGKKLGPGDLIETRRIAVLECVVEPSNKINWDEFEDMFEEIYPGTLMIITGFDEHDKAWLRVMHTNLGKEFYIQKKNIRRAKA